jgi:predicted phage tail protein
MKVVKVYGALRKRLGQCRFEFEAATPAQAIKALCVNFPGLEKWLIDSEKDGVAYRVTIGKEKLMADDLSPLAMPWSERQVFSITPVIAGAGSSGAMIGIGIGIMALAIITGGIASAGAVHLGGLMGIGTYGTIAVGIGASLTLSGISQLISPTVGISTDATDISQLDSTSLSGITNTVNQGLPVPICYGRCFIGSAVISSGLDVDQLI